MKEITVSDANIFIDLHKIGLLDVFFKLPFEIHTTDFVLHELKDKFLRAEIQGYIKEGKLIIKCFSADEIASLMNFHLETQNRLSFQDRSIWFYAKEHGYVLLTGDKALRVKAENDGVSVHGFDCLIEEKILSFQRAIESLSRLQTANKRLPDTECSKKLSIWRENLRNEVIHLSI